jgi:hypothetical protein
VLRTNQALEGAPSLAQSFVRAVETLSVPKSQRQVSTHRAGIQWKP